MPACPRLLPVLAAAMLCGFPGSASALLLLIPKMNVAAPGGWSSPIVPRNVADAGSGPSVSLPDTLFGDRPTYLNWCTQKNPAICGSWTDALHLDEVTFEALGRSSCDWAVEYFPAMNQGPAMIRGGRHTLEVQADVDYTVSTDYDFPPGYLAMQLVWSPMQLSKTGVYSNVPPPAAGDQRYPNCDGYRVERTNPWAWVVGSLGHDVSGDVDLAVDVDPWLGSTTGFTNEAARSKQPAGGVDFVVGTGAGTPSVLYPAVLQGGVPTHRGYSILWADSQDRRDTTASMSWSSDTLGVLRVYEVFLAAGQGLQADLTRLSGADDIELSVFPCTPGGIWARAQAAAVSTPIQGADTDALHYVAPVSGWYPLVVCRNANTTPVVYRLRMGPTATIGAESAPPALAFDGAMPNPATLRTRFRYHLASAGPARLAVGDVQGRRVATLVDGWQPAGSRQIDWDLRDASGIPVRAGLYWAVFESGGHRFTTRLVVTR